MILSKTDLLVSLELINKCLTISSHEDLVDFYSQLKAKVGIESLLVGHNTSFDDNKLKAPQAIFFGISEEWQKLYQQQQYVLIDPVVKLSFETQFLVHWSEAFSKAEEVPEEFFTMAQDFGLRNGMALANMSHPVNGAAAITSVGFNERPATKTQLLMLQQILPHLNDALVRPSIWYTQDLSNKEIEVLKWARAGKSYWETGQIMNISERTVKFHLQNAYRKLDVVNRSQAVARALSLGFL